MLSKQQRREAAKQAAQRALEDVKPVLIVDAAIENATRKTGPICTRCKGFGHAWFDCPETTGR